MRQYVYRDHIEIPIPPVAKGRPRIGRAAGRPVAFTPAKTREAESDLLGLVVAQAPASPCTGAIEIDVSFVLAIPASWPAWKVQAAQLGAVDPITRPDLDNFLKLAIDAMTKAGFWRDDSQIVRARAVKTYGPRPRTEIWITEYRSPNSAKEWAKWIGQ